MIKFHNEEGIIKPQYIAKFNPNFPKTVILTWAWKLENILNKNYDAKIIAYCNSKFPIYSFIKNNIKIGFACCSEGSPFAAQIMEECIARGTEKFVFIGACGLLDKNIKEEIIVPTSALRDEGTSYHYLESEEEIISVPTQPELSKILTELEIPYKEGRTWTTDAIYRETPSSAKYAMQNNCICVDMECSAIMAVSQFRKAESYQLFFTADRIDADKWNRGTLFSPNKSAFENYLKLAVEIAIRIQTNK